jgi:molybdopterin/thiamine biosynthesis adenylyltransferase
MTGYSLTLREVQLDEIKAALIRPDHDEHAAYLICRTATIGRDPWDRDRHVKLLVREVLPVEASDIVEATAGYVTWLTRSLASALKRAEAIGGVVAVIHSHPSGHYSFSSQDDANEPDLLRMVQNRNSPEAMLPSLILTADGVLAGRVWESSKHYVPMRLVRVFGDDFRLHYPGRGLGVPRREFHRQELAFGKALSQDLSMLRIAIVGCGGTGSALALLLVRLGVGQILLIDNDIVEDTNLNRLHTARRSDADAMTPKVDAAKRTLTELALGVRIAAINVWVGDKSCRDALRACDIVFCCTDDHDGRLFLNRFAYYYLTPVIDFGLAMEISKDDPPVFKVLDGRVTVLFPGNTCLSCRGITNSAIAHEEVLKRNHPEAYERQKAERYITGGGVPNPAVVTFTTEVATMAVNELLHRFTEFRGPKAATANRVRKFMLGEDVRAGAASREGCPACNKQDNWGNGDMEPFMDRVE